MGDNSPPLPPKPPLRGKKLAFALAFLELPDQKGRITQAAVKAGVSAKAASKQGSKWLKMADVAAYVREREHAILKHIEDKQLVTKEQLIERLHKVYAQSMQGEPDMIWEDGELLHSGLWKFDSKGACKAVELLGKSINMFSDKIDDKTKEPFNLNIILTPPEPKNAIAHGKTIEHQPPADTPTINLEPPV